MDLDGKMIAHPMSPALIGKNVLAGAGVYE
jgi:hypothetical protein